MMLLLGGCSFPDYDVQQAEPVPVETCRDGLMNANEIDVDCGPSCSASCSSGRACASNTECETGFCNQGVCSAPSCTDAAKNRTETDVDCGGSDGCKACTAGQRCGSNYDCDGGACTNGRCLAPSCGDGLQNQDETDVDCGGQQGCDACLTKQHCNTNADCEKAKCAQGRCQAVGCDDGLKNGDETAVDCGGSCAACPNFSGCKHSLDCQSLVCNPQASICLAPTCNDGIKNGNEPTADCGSSCQKKCGMTASCSLGGDCQSGACVDQRCVPMSATNMALSTAGWVLTASATFNANTLPSKAIDGDGDTQWTSGTSQVPGMWFQLDLLKAVPFFAIELTCLSNDDYPRSIRVLLSEDGETFTPVTGTIAGTKTLRFDFPTAKIARFIKLELEQDTGGTWWRIDELRVLQ